MFQLDEYEISWLLNSANLTYKNEWEMMRYSTYVNAQMNSTKKIKPTDIIKFSWDVEQEKKDTSISKVDIERLRNKAKTIEKQIKK